jgi:phosphoketolase
MGEVIEELYATLDDARFAIERLKEQGYTTSDITAIANADIYGNFIDVVEADVTVHPRTKNDIQDSIWEKVKGIFVRMNQKKEDSDSISSPQADTNPLFSFNKEINAGAVVILITRTLTIL